MLYHASGFRSVSAASHQDAAERFGVTAARRLFGRRGRVGALTAGAYTVDGTIQEWSVFIGRPGRGGRTTTGYTVHLVVHTEGGR